MKNAERAAVYASTIITRAAGRRFVATMFFILAAAILAALPVNAIAQCPAVVWSDEFDGTAVDTSRWSFQTGDGWPTVTAFREQMSVHGKFGQPCPVCGSPVQRIRYAERETNYCARCQTGGRVLKDRSLSRLLKKDWPARIEQWE